MMTGSALVKPDVSHLITHPDVFIPFETYIPVRWDFRDLHEKIDYYLNNAEARHRIAKNAYDVIHKYVVEGKFLSFAKIF